MFGMSGSQCTAHPPHYDTERRIARGGRPLLSQGWLRGSAGVGIKGIPFLRKQESRAVRSFPLKWFDRLATNGNDLALQPALTIANTR